MKRFFRGVFLALAAVSLCSCGAPPPSPAASEGKVRIVATLFPQYDFAKAIAGDRAEVSLLLPPGMDSHAYEPTPQDMLAIHQADLFVYTGPAMESWAQTIVDSLPEDGVAVDVSQGIALSGEEGHEAHDHGPSAHGHSVDPHIWTDPRNAQHMVDTLLEALCRRDPDNAACYRENARRYQGQLSALDDAFAQAVSQGARRTLVFGSPFSLYYFTQRYGLSYRAAFDSCAGESEPSAYTLVQLIEFIRAQRIPVVYVTELTDRKVAEVLREETGAKVLLFHACHNVSKEEFAAGATYLSLMWQNVENLKEGLR